MYVHCGEIWNIQLSFLYIFKIDSVSPFCLLFLLLVKVVLTLRIIIHSESENSARVG